MQLSCVRDCALRSETKTSSYCLPNAISVRVKHTKLMRY